jgi:DNA-3-methyladenine glycosylase II
MQFFNPEVRECFRQAIEQELYFLLDFGDRFVGIQKESTSALGPSLRGGNRNKQANRIVEVTYLPGENAPRSVIITTIKLLVPEKVDEFDDTTLHMMNVCDPDITAMEGNLTARFVLHLRTARQVLQEHFREVLLGLVWKSDEFDWGGLKKYRLSLIRENPRMPSSPHAKAQRHLSRRCPVMRDVIKRVGPCTLVPFPHDPFTLLVRCVISQQISTKAAQSIFDRLATACGGPPIESKVLARLTDKQLAACGLSGGKQRTLRALVTHFDANPRFSTDIETTDDDTLREQLTAIKGIGPWTVDMFLMFGILRPDVLPVGDLGIKVGFQLLFKLDEHPAPQEMIELAKPWTPYRTIACWYIWRALEAAKQQAAASK